MDSLRFWQRVLHSGEPAFITVQAGTFRVPW